MKKLQNDTAILIPYTNIMKLSKVKIFLLNTGLLSAAQIEAICKATPKRICIEETKPYDTLHDSNVYLETYRLSLQLPHDLFRHLECEVVQAIIEQRYTQPVNY